MATAKHDVIIVGAGPAGAICARSCARAGLKTLLLDAKPAKDLGIPIVVEMEGDVYAACDIPAPEAGELPFQEKGVRVFAGSGKLALSGEGGNVGASTFFQNKLVRRLVGYAKQAGAKTLFETRVEAPLCEGDTVVGVSVVDKKGARRQLTAAVVVDATGFAAAVLRHLPARCGMEFIDRREDHVLADARLYRVNRDKARAAAEQGRLLPEYAHHTLSSVGCYSTLTHLVSLEYGQAWLLVGVKEDDNLPGASELVDKMAADLGYLDERLSGGRATIRIRRANARLVCNGFAVIGEAASMVIPAHASGIASGLRAGHKLGEHLGKLLNEGGRPTTASLWPWAAAYQRGRGAILASYDFLRRGLEDLDLEKELWPLLEELMNEDDMEMTLHAKPIRVKPGSLPARLSGLAKHPLLAARFMRNGLGALLVERHWQNFPERWDYQTFLRWKRKAQALLP